jgi:hypothetical protein
VGAVTGTTFSLLLQEGNIKITVVKVPRQCSLVLPLKVDWQQDKTLGSEQGMVLWSGLERR